MRAPGVKVIVLIAALVCLALLARSILNTQPLITMTIRQFVTNNYIFPPKDGPTNYICAIVEVMNHSGSSMICSAEHAVNQIIILDDRTTGFNKLTVGSHTNFTFEAVLCRGFTNKLELIFTPTQTPWPFRHLPAAILQWIPQKLQMAKDLKVSTPEFYVAKNEEDRLR
jgi:hypothetical protein